MGITRTYRQPTLRGLRPTQPAPPPPPAPARQPLAPIRLPCRWEGPVVTWCPRDDENLHERRCLNDAGPDLCRRAHECRTCPPTLYAPPPPPTDPQAWTRHLLYYVYPVRGNGTWQRNLDQLAARLPLFNGRRLIAVGTEEPHPKHRLDPPAAVRDRLAGLGCGFVEVQNDQRLREVAALGPLWGSLADYARPDHCTFFAHAKGVTRPVNAGVSVHPWTDLLYRANLDFWPVVADSLARHPCTGALKKVGEVFRRSLSQWHYSGAFYWMRNADILGRNWRHVDRTWWGIETWPSLHYGVDEAGCVFCERVGNNINGYDFENLRGILREFDEWTRTNAAYRTATGSAAASSPPA
jgi:hypothetical protein